MFKVGIIGTSKITHKHIHAVSKFPNLKIQSILGTYESSLTEFSKRYQIEPHTTPKTFLENPPEIAIITTSSERHLQVLETLIPKIPNLIVEKPLTTKLADTQKILKYAAENKANIFVVSQKRFDDQFQLLSKAIRETSGPKLIKMIIRKHRSREYYRGNKSISKALVFSQLPHYLDLAIEIFGKELEVTDARTSNSQGLSKFSDTFFGKFRSGVNWLELSISTCSDSNYPIQIDCIGSDRTFQTKGFLITKDSKNRWIQNFWLLFSEPKTQDSSSFYNMYANFLEKIIARQRDRSELERALLISENIERILIQTGEINLLN